MAALMMVAVASFLALSYAIQEESMDSLVPQKFMLKNVTGPESIAFDPSGGGPYTGVSDGRILKWHGHLIGWVEFAVPPLRRRALCDGSNNVLLESKCGRTLGLQFSMLTGDLYMADTFNGLLSVGPSGGVASQLATEADGLQFHFLNGLDIDQVSDVVYFTDSSTNYRRSDYLRVVVSGDATGRLMKYDPKTKKVIVLLKGLVFPNGVALSKDRSFILICESSLLRVVRYWLRGPRAGTTDVFADQLPGYPDNIKRNSVGEFWVALVHLDNHIAVRLSRDGRVVEILDGTISTSISEVGERNGTLWFGSVSMSFVGAYRYRL